MRTSAKHVFWSMASLTALAYGPPVLAQTTGSASPSVPAGSAETRTALPDMSGDTSYEPVGARFGSFMLYPKLEGGVVYNDNIYALANKTDDFIGKLSPSLDFRGDLGSATAALRASLDRYEYFDASTESRTDWSLGANASVEASRGTFIYAAGGFTRGHEDRGDPNAVYTDRHPTEYSLAEAGAGFSTSVTRLKLGLDASYRHFDYRDNVQINGVVTNNDDRDKGVVRASGRVGFEFSPGYSVMARVTYDAVDYRFKFDDAGYNRKSNGWRGTLGLNFELSNLLEGEVWGGYLTRSYDDARFQKFEGAIFGSGLTWHPSQLTDVTLNVDRNVVETVTPGYRGFLSTTASLGIEHEILRNVKFSAEASYGHDDYLRDRVTTNPDRDDDTYGAKASIKYMLNRNVYGTLAYDWTKRSSSVNFPGFEFDRNRITAAVGLQF